MEKIKKINVCIDFQNLLKLVKFINRIRYKLLLTLYRLFMNYLCILSLRSFNIFVLLFYFPKTNKVTQPVKFANKYATEKKKNFKS